MLFTTYIPHLGKVISKSLVLRYLDFEVTTSNMAQSLSLRGQKIEVRNVGY
jgi:hypothetical protein